MDKAKDAVKKFTSKSGQHDTTIHEQVAPAVQHETVRRAEHEKTIPVVDREVHQDHYHTSVQPVQHAETLPEQHHHKAVPVEHRTFEHDNDETVRRKLDEERAQFRDHQQRVEGEKTTSTDAAVTGQHVHHHVHENIQPIVQKETVEPHVVHTTVPVHEVHHNAAQHHSSSALPPVSMDDFKHQGGSLQGRGERQDHFAGEPRSFGGESRLGEANPVGAHHPGTSGTTGTTGLDGRGMEPGRTGDYPTNTNTTTTTNTSTTTSAKPSLKDRLDPRKDTDGDGKTGMLD